MSVEDVEKNADAILLQYAKNDKFEFSAQPESSLKHIVSDKKKPSRYGNLFSK
jgi:hypothetical protein